MRFHRPSWLLGGVLPEKWSDVPRDVLAGITLAALGIPEVLGYAKIADMPVVTGLYTLLVPMAVFALLGSSRHLVVGADSATAAILASGVAGMAAPGSPRWVALAGLAALLAGLLLLVARLVRLGFLANFLSRTVLVGFLTGVGVQVACGQLGDMIGVGGGGHGTVAKVVAAIRGAPHAHLATAALSIVVIAVVLGVQRLTRKVPGALVAVVGAIAASTALDLPARGVAVLGPVPSGLPHPSAPLLSLSDAAAIFPAALSMFVVILAQSSATSRAYAARYDEAFDEDVDLVGLGLANVAAAFTGTFVVNGSPTKTEMVDGAGGKSQVAQLTTCVVVLAVLLFVTGPLSHLPIAVLASIVFLIGIELVDVRGMRRIWQVGRRAELVVALLTAAAVVFVGVEQGILLAIALSIVDHLRHSYAPPSAVLVAKSEHHFELRSPADAGARTQPGLVVYRFGSSLYYANANRFSQEVLAFATHGDRVRWLCVDCVAIYDVDYSAAATLRRLVHKLTSRGVRFVLCEVSAGVRRELERYGLVAEIGDDAFFEMPSDVVDAFVASQSEPDVRNSITARGGELRTAHGSHPDPAF